VLVDGVDVACTFEKFGGGVGWSLAGEGGVGAEGVSPDDFAGLVEPWPGPVGGEVSGVGVDEGVERAALDASVGGCGGGLVCGGEMPQVDVDVGRVEAVGVGVTFDDRRCRVCG
jgi:hypothetical protein